MTFLDALKRIGVMLGGIVVLLGVTSVVQLLLHERVPDAVGATIVLVVLFGTYIVYVRLTERRRVSELDPRAMTPQVLLGLAIGVLLFVAVIGVLALHGNYHYAGRGVAPGLMTALLLTVVSSVGEEIIFRGFVFRVVQSIGGTWLAVGISAIIFGALHGINPHATVLSSLAIAVEAGGLLAFAYAATQKLWMPIGLHVGWNFTEGSIFGVPVSGNKSLPSLFVGHVSGPGYLTGGSFGVEASLVAAIVCVLATSLIVAYAARTRRIVPMRARVRSAER